MEVVPDGVASPQTDPVGDRAVLLLRLCELLLRAEGLVGLKHHHDARQLLRNLFFCVGEGTYRHLWCRCCASFPFAGCVLSLADRKSKWWFLRSISKAPRCDSPRVRPACRVPHVMIGFSALLTPNSSALYCVVMICRFQSSRWRTESSNESEGHGINGGQYDSLCQTVAAVIDGCVPRLNMRYP